jgi:predicted solute-binding protein
MKPIAPCILKAGHIYPGSHVLSCNTYSNREAAEQAGIAVTSNS